MAGTSGLSTGRLGESRQIGSTAGLLSREADKLRKKGYEAASAKLALAASEAKITGQRGIASADSRMAEDSYLDRLEQGLLKSQARGLFGGQAAQGQGQPAPAASAAPGTKIPSLLARPEGGAAATEGTPEMLAADPVADRRQAERKTLLSRVRAEASADPSATRQSVLDRINKERVEGGKAPMDISGKEFADEDRGMAETRRKGKGVLGRVAALTSKQPVSGFNYYPSLLNVRD